AVLARGRGASGSREHAPEVLVVARSRQPPLSTRRNRGNRGERGGDACRALSCVLGPRPRPVRVPRCGRIGAPNPGGAGPGSGVPCGRTRLGPVRPDCPARGEGRGPRIGERTGAEVKPPHAARADGDLGRVTPLVTARDQAPLV